MVENRKKHRQNSNLIIYCPTSEGASERVSSASERVNGPASGPVLQSVFLAVLAHSATFPCLPSPLASGRLTARTAPVISYLPIPLGDRGVSFSDAKESRIDHAPHPTLFCWFFYTVEDLVCLKATE